MAQYEVTAGCGHTTTVQLYGPHSERERRLAWTRSAGGQCNACYAATRREQEARQREAKVRELADQIKAHRDQLTPGAVGDIRAQIAAGLGDETRRKAMTLALDELGL